MAQVKRKFDTVSAEYPTAKRQRAEVTAGHKRKICEYKRDHPNLKYPAIQAWADFFTLSDR